MKGIKRKWQPGAVGAFQGVSFEDYLNAPGINKSHAIQMDEQRGGCPRKFKEYKPDSERKPHFDFGKACHALVLEGKMEYAISPYDSYRTNEAKAWRDEQTQPIITQADEDEIVAACKAIKASPAIWNLIKHGRREVSMWAEYDGRFLLKCRPDIIQPGWAVDIKTTTDASTHAFSRQLYRYGYDLQAAIVWKVCALLNMPIAHYYIIAIERGATPLFNARRIDEETMQAAQTKLDMILADIADCEKAGTWPDYTGKEIGEISAPKWTLPDDMMIEGAMMA